MAVWGLLIGGGLLAWLIGSIPFSLLIARAAGGVDLRQHGSGNVGATNVARVLGAKWGALALLCDVSKGALPVWLLPDLWPAPPDWIMHQRVLYGVAAILGHMYPPWLLFRGGKGVATGLGAALMLAPWPAAAAFAAFAVLFALRRIVSLASIVASLIYAAAVALLHGGALWSSTQWSLGAFSIAAPALIIWRHRSNILRLWTGQETPLSLGGQPPVAHPADANTAESVSSQPANAKIKSEAPPRTLPPEAGGP